MRWRGIAGLLALGVALLVTTASAAAATFSVTGLTDPIGATCTGTTCTSLRAAIAAATMPANLGSTVSLATGTYVLGGGAGMATGPLAIGADVSLLGDGAGSTTIEQADSGDGVISITSNVAHVTIGAVTVTGGSAVGSAGANGGGSSSGSPGGEAVGGISDLGSLTLNAVAVDGDTAAGGSGGNSVNDTPGAGGTAVGGIDVASGASLTVNGGSVTGDIATGGTGGPYHGSGGSGTAGGLGGDAVGAIKVDAGAGAVRISGATISNDAATGGPGGESFGESGSLPGAGGRATGGLLDLGGQQVSIAAATLDGDTATGGPGLFAEMGLAASAGGAAFGGAVYDFAGPVTVSDSSLVSDAASGGTGGGSGNAVAAGQGGAGVGGVAAIDAAGALTVLRSTLADANAAGGAGGPLQSGSIVSPGAGGGAAEGGAIYNDGIATLVNDTITENRAEGGAGAAASAPQVPGTDGLGLGGAVLDESVAAGETLTLDADTVDGNAAQSPTPGNGLAGNVGLGDSSWTLADTIIAGGIASGAGANCASGQAPTDVGHNLEQSSPSECGLSAAKNDQIGVDPELGPLSSNGGPGLTLAPAPASPVRAAGGTCVDLSQAGNPALTTDERGTARHTPCDIGAFETQPPLAGGPVTLSGNAMPGVTLTCSAPSFGGDGPITTTVRWLRAGAAIAGATASGYVVGAADVGDDLTCAVTATNEYGSSTVTSNPLKATNSPGKATPPASQVFSGAKLSSRKLTYQGKGKLTLRVICPSTATGGRCSFAIALYAARGKLPATTANVKPRKPAGATLLGRASATITAGHSKTIDIKLDAAGRRLVRRLPAHARLLLTSRGSVPAPSTHRYPVSIVTAARKHHR
jgi:hypothetical protein